MYLKKTIIFMYLSFHLNDEMNVKIKWSSRIIVNQSFLNFLDIHDFRYLDCELKLLLVISIHLSNKLRFI
ncbi:hypothetical protein DERP_008148 [Dermatophagoides pteronyssinus]|uniref:Uncharacterized protein n=1 Tax=Dermatophagoides pteronyssinus TaxID=6956 RepID=A0ABQ8JJV2_DERPT|nr:hypothetical protein DERP_008148 [Dermatophagoides pteronyssinus]